MSLIKSFFKVLAQILAQTLLTIMGWHLPNEHEVHRITKYDRIVLVFSHSSYWDFFIMALYVLAYPNDLHRLRTLISPGPFKYANFLMRYIGGIPATSVHDREQGSVTRIVGELQKCEKPIFLISPKGTLTKHEWRSGYYHIAQQLNCSIRVVGVDYDKKDIVLGRPYSPINISEDNMREHLYHDLGHVVPLHPKNEMMFIRKHNERLRSVVNWRRLLGIMIFLWLWRVL